MRSDVLWAVFVLVPVRAGHLHEHVLNATARILNVDPDPALTRSVSLKFPKVFWKQVLKGDTDTLRYMTGTRYFAVRGILPPCLILLGTLTLCLIQMKLGDSHHALRLT